MRTVAHLSEVIFSYAPTLLDILRLPEVRDALAAAEHVRPQSIGQTVDMLERRAWAERTRTPRDRRQVVVALTLAGQHALTVGHDLRQAWLVQALTTRFTLEERARITDAITLLERIVDE